MGEFSYGIRIFFSEEDGGYIATIPELPGCSAFGETPEKAVKEVRIAASLWLQAAKKEKRPIPEPILKKKFPGKFVLRMPPNLQAMLFLRAKEEGLSLNQYILYHLAQAQKTQSAQQGKRYL
ncbi:MAG: type II toxin-antitoxin system HicB family antitoxin [Elusimicrobia bacterium]|nr:type II toxin-antitoxin system HicB family antitoxin [Elusimicrobiota bacterium]